MTKMLFPGTRGRTEHERFFEKIWEEEGHWLWLGAHKPRGYGMFWFRGDENFIAHRASYLMFKGEIPSHLVVDHACRVKSCVNPDHLRLITQADNCTTFAPNAPWGINKRKTHCVHGHPLSGSNVARILIRGKAGTWQPSRNCLTCYPSYHGHPRRFWLPEDLAA